VEAFIKGKIAIRYATIFWPISSRKIWKINIVMSQQGYLNLRLGVSATTERQPKKLTSRTYKGFSTVANSSTSPALYDLQLIKQDLINHFHLRKGEKLENPNFGTIIWDVLYEQLTDQIKALIVSDVTEIVNSDPRTQVLQTIVTQKEQAIQIEITLKYIPYNIQETMQFTFDTANGLI
jgi:phage baseplate assembly protein W